MAKPDRLYYGWVILGTLAVTEVTSWGILYDTFPVFLGPMQQELGWSRVELIVIDELGYVPLAEVAAELLFQVIAERAEKAAIIVTTNLPFSEWPQVFTNTRLCKAVLDRLTDQAHIIETGSESYRFRRTLRKKVKQ